MKIIPASYEIIDIPSANNKIAVLKHIERIARTCYKSEDRITDTSCFKMIENLKVRKHWAMFEHYVFPILIDRTTAVKIDKTKANIAFTKFSRSHSDNNYIESKLDHSLKFVNVSSVHLKSVCSDRLRDVENFVVTVSATTINNIIDCINEFDNSPNLSGLEDVIIFLYNQYPELINRPSDKLNESSATRRFRFLNPEEVCTMDGYARLMHEYMTVKFIVDRGVSHEIVRHRPASYAQESTRYCNYSKDGFGNEITVIAPNFFRPNTPEYDCWKRACKSAEHEYFELLKLGATPQEARSVLPNSLKTEIIMTANLQEWIHFFRMRVPETAHPQMREVSVPLFKEVSNTKSEVFNQYILN